jgi:hypothetical protein
MLTALRAQSMQVDLKGAADVSLSGGGDDDVSLANLQLSESLSKGAPRPAVQNEQVDHDWKRAQRSWTQTALAGAKATGIRFVVEIGVAADVAADVAVAAAVAAAVVAADDAEDSHRTANEQRMRQKHE